MFEKIKPTIYKSIRIILVIFVCFLLIDPLSYFFGDISCKYNSSPFLRYINGYNWSHSNYQTGWTIYHPQYQIVNDIQVKLECKMSSQKFNVSDSSALFFILPNNLDRGLTASSSRRKINDYFLAVNIQKQSSTHEQKSEYALAYDKELTDYVYTRTGPFYEIESGYGDFVCLDHIMGALKNQVQHPRLN